MWNLFFGSSRRQRMLDEPLPESRRAILRHKVPITAHLPLAERGKLEDAVKIILAERPFEGIRDFEITDEVEVTIAAQAALLLLGNDGYFFDRVTTILVQAGNHVTRVAHDLGSAVLIEEGVLAEGQASLHGEIRLNWDEVLAGAADPTDGENVVLHEFAHHLDGLDGEMDGIPPLSTAKARRHWQDVFDQEMIELRRELRSGGEPFLHDAAAQNPAELFAYSTECFFEQPRELEEWNPELFACLLEFYKVDPRTWNLKGET